MPERSVLIVEDDALLRETAVLLLEEMGYRVLAADCAKAALRELKEHASDIAVVFTDVQMPGPIDGVALARIVEISWPQIAILLTSGNSRLEPSDLPSSAHFLPKPWLPLDVISRVEQLTVGAGEGAAPVLRH